MIRKKDIEFLYLAADIARETMKKNNHPFGAIVVDEDDNVIYRSPNKVYEKHNTCAHAESEAAYYLAGIKSSEYLSRCTLYTTVEPCCMCSGSIYWANFKRVVFGISEKELLALTSSTDENSSLDLSCETVLSTGQKTIIVDGPVEDEDLRNRIIEDHKNYW